MKLPIDIPWSKIGKILGISLVAWVVLETLIGTLRGNGRWFGEALSLGAMGGAIGIGLILRERVTRANGKLQAQRLAAGLVIGGLAGLIAGSLGNFLYLTFHASRLIGWTILGAGVGSAEGLFERSTTRLRRGLLAGLIGGLIGGFLFEQISGRISPFSIVLCRGLGFVLLSFSIALLVELSRSGMQRGVANPPSRSDDPPAPSRPAAKPPGSIQPISAKPPTARPSSPTPATPVPRNGQAKSPVPSTAKAPASIACPNCGKILHGNQPYCVKCDLYC